MTFFSCSNLLFDPNAKRRLNVIAAIGLSLMISFTGIFDHELIASAEI